MELFIAPRSGGKSTWLAQKCFQMCARAVHPFRAAVIAVSRARAQDVRAILCTICRESEQMVQISGHVVAVGMGQVHFIGAYNKALAMARPQVLFVDDLDALMKTPHTVAPGLIARATADVWGTLFVTSVPSPEICRLIPGTGTTYVVGPPDSPCALAAVEKELAALKIE